MTVSFKLYLFQILMSVKGFVLLYFVLILDGWGFFFLYSTEGKEIVETKNFSTESEIYVN